MEHEIHTFSHLWQCILLSRLSGTLMVNIGSCQTITQVEICISILILYLPGNKTCRRTSHIQ